MKSKRILLLLLMVLFVPIIVACGAPAGEGTGTGAPAAATTPASAAAGGATASTAASTAAATGASPAASTAASTAGGTETSAAASAAVTNPGGLAVSQSGYKGTLSYWVLGYQPGGAGLGSKLMDAAVANFQAANPDITVQITGYTGNQEGFTKLTQAVQGGEGVDLFRLPSDILPLLVKDGLVAPIDEYLTAEDKADIFPNLLQSVSIDGKAYAWPLWVPPVGMYLNLDIFKEAGVEPPQGTWTYDQFVETAKKLTFKRADGTQVYGYTALIDPGVVNAWPFILSDGALPLSADNTKYTWDTPEAASGLKKLVDLAQVHKVTPPDFGSQTLEEIQGGFKDKKIYAMYSEPSGASSGYKDAGMNFEVVSMPTGATGKPVTAGGIGLISVAQGDDKAKVQAAMDLARYLTSGQVQQDVPGFYLAPGARKSVEVADPISKFSPFVESTYITPIIETWPQIRTILHPQIQNAIFGQISPEEALKAPAEEINGILSGQQ